MTSTLVDRVAGLAEGLAIKAPVRADGTPEGGNITLRGLQTVDVFALEEGDPLLAKDNNDGTENGIYLASSGIGPAARISMARATSSRKRAYTSRTAKSKAVANSSSPHRIRWKARPLPLSAGSIAA